MSATQMTTPQQTRQPPANDNQQRPAEFDARVMAYEPGLRSLAGKFCRGNKEARDDLVTDTIIYALAKWRNFREDGGMWNWLEWCMRAVVTDRAYSASRQKRTGRTVPIEDFMHLSTAPTQHDSIEAKDVLSRITGRAGGVLLKRAIGYEIEEIAEEMGISRARVWQLEGKAREQLSRTMTRKGRRAA